MSSLHPTPATGSHLAEHSIPSAQTTGQAALYLSDPSPGVLLGLLIYSMGHLVMLVSEAYQLLQSQSNVGGTTSNSSIPMSDNFLAHHHARRIC